MSGEPRFFAIRCRWSSATLLHTDHATYAALAPCWRSAWRVHQDLDLHADTKHFRGHDLIVTASEDTQA
jgi:hypothetical protein